MGPWGCESSIGQSRVVVGSEKQSCQWEIMGRVVIQEIMRPVGVMVCHGGIDDG
jgi:hypothetical protein